MLVYTSSHGTSKAVQVGPYGRIRVSSANLIASQIAGILSVRLVQDDDR